MAANLVLFSIKNLTSGTQIHNSTGSQGGLEMVEWKEHVLVFQSQAKALPGQLVALAGKITVGKQSWPFEATGKVTSVAPHLNNLNRFEISLQQFDRAVWRRYLDAISSGQDRVDQIFRGIRGED